MPELESIDIVRARDRHFTDFGWLKTYWLFSFANYYDPHNIQFGALRVFNDDIVEPWSGFPTHPHEEMEIVTIVLDGEMTHQDSMGNRAGGGDRGRNNRLSHCNRDKKISKHPLFSSYELIFKVENSPMCF